MVMKVPSSGMPGMSTRCPNCHLKESDVRATGRLGCPVCYRAFRHVLAELMPTLQIGLLHVGKRPRGPEEAPIDVPYADAVRDVFMNEAVRQENFELAAAMRDRLGASAIKRWGEDA